jgi:hypothetical protein
MYKAQSMNGRIWIRKDERVTLLQRHIKDQIEDDLKIKAPGDTYCYTCNVAFCSSKHDWVVDDSTKLRVLDLSNIWKVIEDGIFPGLDINDAFGVCNTQSKCILPKEIQSPPHYIAVYIKFYKLRGSNGK